METAGTQVITNPNPEQEKVLVSNQVQFLEHFRQFVLTYMTKVKTLTGLSGTFFQKLASVDGVYVSLILALGIFYLGLGLKFKKMSFATIFFYVAFRSIKHYNTFFDPICKFLGSGIYSVFPDFSLKIFGPPENNVAGAILLAITMVILALVILYFMKIILTAFIYIFASYEIYIHVFKFRNMNMNIYAEAAISLILGLAFILIGQWINEIVYGIIVSFIGSVIVFAFCWGRFNFPSNFDQFVNQLFKESYLGSMFNLNFFYVALLNLLSVLFQKKLFFGKKVKHE